MTQYEQLKCNETEECKNYVFIGIVSVNYTVYLIVETADVVRIDFFFVLGSIHFAAGMNVGGECG